MAELTVKIPILNTKTEDEKRKEELVADYVSKAATWYDLLAFEENKRLEICGGDLSNETPELKDEIEQFLAKHDCKARKIVAVNELKEAESALFSFLLRHAIDPEERNLIRSFSQDYAQRISFLKRNYLPGVSEIDVIEIPEDLEEDLIVIE